MKLRHMKLYDTKLAPVQNISGICDVHNPQTVESLAQEALKTETLPAPIQVKLVGTVGKGFDTDYLYEAVGGTLMLAVARRVLELSPRVGGNRTCEHCGRVLWL
jgi:hypothetical protein